MNERDLLCRRLRALAHPTRIAILEAVEQRPCGPVDVYADVGASLGTVSHHFRALAGAGLLELAGTEQRRGALKHTYRPTADAARLLRAARELEPAVGA